MLLSIVIPSHNKSSYLKKAIESIIKDYQFGNDINLILSDNSLNSEIKNLYDDYFSSNENIEYYNSKEFNSLDSNVNRAIELSKGKYAWVFGDDDILVKGVLVKILKFLKTKKPHFLICNSKTFSGKGIIESSRMPSGISSIFKEEENDKFLKEMGGYLTYVGSIIVNKDLWIENYNKSKIGSFFAHIDCIASIKNNRRGHYFKDPAIKMRLGSQTWLDQSFKIWYLYYPNLIWGLKNYSDDAKKSVIPKKPLNSLKLILSGRAYKRIDFQKFKKYIFYSKEIFPINKFFILIVVLLPSAIFTKLYLIYIHFFKRNQSINFSPKLAIAQLKSN